MLRSYLAIALRNLAAQKLYSAINVVGLAVGLASFVLISLFVRHELSYDDFFANAERTYRISRDYFASGGARARVPAPNNAPVAPALLEDFPEIEATARVFGGGSLLRHGETAFYEDRFRWADGSIFRIFDFDWVAGDPATALAEPRSIVVTERLAAKYFGADDPLGQTLLLEGNVPLEVTGVIRELPANTHLSLDALGSLSTLVALAGPRTLELWNSSTDFHTYFLLAEGASIDAIERRIPDFMNRRIATDASSWSGMTVMNIRDIHTRTTRDEEWKPAGSLAVILSFTAIAALILLVACINFMNLSIARSTKRGREVGVRKSLGASRAELIAQFLGESVLTAALAMFLAVVLVELALPAFNAFLGTELTLDYFGPESLAVSLAGLTVLVGIVAGAYPALYLSSYDPARVLRGDVVRGTGGAAFRNSLIVVQFSVAIALLIGTAIVYEQWSFARNLDLGFNKDQVVLLGASRRTGLGPQWPALKQRLLEHPGITHVTASHYTPFSWDDNAIFVRAEGDTSSSRIQYMTVDYDFFETYDIGVLAGRSFSRDFGSAEPSLLRSQGRLSGGGLIVNESAARLLGWQPSAAADQTLELARDEAFAQTLPVPVVGVVRDTYFEPVHLPIRPMMYVLAPDGQTDIQMIDTASVRVTGDLAAPLEHIDASWRELVPDQPVMRHFLDEDFEALYRSERRQAQIFTAFSALAIFIACLGLFGLASLTTQRRTKEIGIRKTMGATIWDVVRLFTSEFGKLVLLANIAAWPIAYLAMQRWLTGFAYRIDMSFAVFVGAALLAVLVALATVGGVAARAASVKPMYSLRYE